MLTVKSVFTPENTNVKYKHHDTDWYFTAKGAVGYKVRNQIILAK